LTSLSLYAFGDTLFFNSKKECAENAAPQVPEGLIFRKLPHWMYRIKWPTKFGAFSVQKCGWNDAENRRLSDVMVGYFGGGGKTKICGVH